VAQLAPESVAQLGTVYPLLYFEIGMNLRKNLVKNVFNNGIAE